MFLFSTRPMQQDTDLLNIGRFAWSISYWWNCFHLPSSAMISLLVFSVENRVFGRSSEERGHHRSSNENWDKVSYPTNIWIIRNWKQWRCTGLVWYSMVKMYLSSLSLVFFNPTVRLRCWDVTSFLHAVRQLNTNHNVLIQVFILSLVRFLIIHL